MSNKNPIQLKLFDNGTSTNIRNSNQEVKVISLKKFERSKIEKKFRSLSDHLL